MSGVEAITIVQLIGACIDITKAVIDIGRAAKDAKDLPPNLKELFERLPAINDLLVSARERAESNEISEDSRKSVESVLEQCKSSLERLRALFWKACPEDGDNYGKRLWKGTKTVFLGRDSRLQKQMNDIMESLKILELKGIFSIDDKLDDLTEIVQVLAEEDVVKNAHYGNGNQNIHQGPGNQYNIGGGRNNTFNQNFGTHIHHDRVDPSLADQCLQSLAFPNMEVRGDISEKAEHTCEWILNHKDYRTWIKRGGLLWIKGRAGTGKSTLMKYITERSTRNRTSSLDYPDLESRTLVVSFFFDRRGSTLHQSAIGLFRSVLHQILRYDDTLLYHFLKDTQFEEHYRTKGGPGRDKKWDWVESDLRELFLRYVKGVTSTRDVRLYVDALDEGGQAVARQLMALFKDCGGDVAPRLSICVSCRPYPERISTYDYCIDVVKQTQHDIRRFLEAYFGEWPEWANKAVLQIVKDEIISRASGVFQWVIIVAGRVVKMRDEDLASILASITSLPEDLDDLYHEMFESLRKENSKDRRKALRLFRWITFAKEPLTLAELRYAVAVDADSILHFVDDCKSSVHWCEDDEKMSKRIQRLTFGMVEPNRPSVQFDHESVRDYMLARGIASLEEHQGSSPTAIARGRSQAILSRVCFRYLAAGDILAHSEIALKKFDQNKGDKDHHYRYAQLYASEAEPAFLLGPYARKHCWEHASLAEAEAQSLQYIFEVTRWPSFQIAYAWGMPADHCQRQRLSRRMTLQHLAAYYGLSSIIEQIPSEENKLSLRKKLPLELSSGLDPKDHDGCTPLWYAAFQGQEATVSLLLESEQVCIDSRNRQRRTPFSIAVETGHENIVRLLLSSDQVDVNAQDNLERTPFSIAVDKGYQRIVRMLLRSERVHVNCMDYRQQTPLTAAVQRGNETIIKVLLGSERVDVNSRDYRQHTPLSIAVQKGRESTIKLLLESERVDANPRDASRRTPFESAVEKGEEKVVQLLLGSERVDVNMQDILKRTPLAAAVERNQENMIKMLLGSDRVDVNFRDVQRRTLLTAAVESDRKDITKLLLEYDRVDVNLQDKQQRTPLAVAVEKGYKDIVGLLLRRRDVDFNASNWHRQTPFWRAAYLGHEEIAKMIFETNQGCIWTKDEFGCRPIWAAVQQGHAHILRLFLESTVVDVNSKVYSNLYSTIHRKDAKTLLELAAERGHANIVQLLLETGDLDVHTINKSCIVATRNGYEEIVRLLLGTGKVNTKEKLHVGWRGQNYASAFEMAERHGRLSIAKLIRDHELNMLKARERAWTM